MVIGALAAGASIGSSIIGGKKAKKAAKKQLGKIVGTYRDYGALVDRLFGAAHGELGKLGASAKATALEREKGFMGQASQSMANRGLYNTTAYDSLRRGIASDTTRSLQQIDEDIAQMKMGLFTSQAGAKLPAFHGIAGAYGDVQNVGGGTDFLGPLLQMQKFNAKGGFGAGK